MDLATDTVTAISGLARLGAAERRVILFLSMLAALEAPIIMMSQTRQAAPATAWWRRTTTR